MPPTKPSKRKSENVENVEISHSKKARLSHIVFSSSDEAEDAEDLGDFHIWDTSDILAEATNISKQTSKNIIQLIEEGNTVPFIARYRKNMIENMSPERLQDIFECYEEKCALKKKAINLLKSLKKKGKLTESLQIRIIGARTIFELNLLGEPFKTQNNFSEKLKELGLEKAINEILSGKSVWLSNLCNSEMKSIDIVQENLIHGLAIEIHKELAVLDVVKNLYNDLKSKFQITCHKARKKQNKEDEPKNKETEAKFDIYLGSSFAASFIKPHQVLAINRGEDLNVLSVKVVIPDQILNEIHKFCRRKWKNMILLNESVDDAYKRFFHPWFCRRIRRELTTNAIKESVNVFCSNLKRLLLTKPIKADKIMGIDPGFRHGCKFGIIDAHGNPLDTFVLYPKFNTKGDEGYKLCQIIEKHKCNVIALGDGTGCRETEKWLYSIGALKNASLVIVPEQGASIYSCSTEASKEFPKMDPNLISAISLARRAMDPLSELIKVKPKHIGVGMYQHDVPPKLLNEALDNVVVNCVSFVGIDINTASHNLLVKVAGLSDKKVQHILAYRDKIAGFRDRKELLKVIGIGPKTYKQCIGFLRISNGKNKLDRTWIHPESYKLTYKFLKHLKADKDDIGSEKFIADFKNKTAYLDLKELSSQFKCNENDLELIIECLTQISPQDNIRDIKPVYSMDVNSNTKLEEGTILRGVVRNVTTFGVFVDCGIGKPGLIHNSQLGNAGHPQLGDRVVVSIVPSFVPNKISFRLIEIINQ